jgi:hypothetical protein
MHWLRRPGDIDNRQAAVAEADAVVAPYACPIWTPVGQRIAHSLNPRRINRFGGFCVKDPGNSAHSARPSA